MNHKIFECGTRSGERGVRAAPRKKLGAVQMEYVILAVLIAAAGVVAVIVFGRSVVSSFLTASDAATLEHTRAREEHISRRQDRRDDANYSKQYHDAMHQ